MKTILYATDHTHNSVSALHFAYGLSKRLKVELFALHVFDVPLVLGSTTSIAYAQKEVKVFAKNRQKLREFCARHLDKYHEKSNIFIRTEEESPIWKGILKTAKEIKADLIVVGTKGDSTVREVLLGSTTTALIEKADCPVLAIPPHTAFKSINKIVYASDFESSDIFTIENLVAFAVTFDAKIYLVHITNKDKKTSGDQMEWFKKMLRHKVDYENIHFETRFGIDVFDTLQNYVNEIEPDLVAMLERENGNPLKDLWHGDLVKRMKREGHYPLLSFNEKHVAP